MNSFDSRSNLKTIVTHGRHPFQTPVSTIPNNSNSNNKNERELIRLSLVTSKNESEFLDFPLFVISIENISTILESHRPGPYAEIDFYHLYCAHIQGDRHVLRTMQNLVKYLVTPEMDEMMSIASKLATSQKLKQKKLLPFYQLHGLVPALEDPFICQESLVRLVLLNIWKNEGKGKMTRKKMARLYISYCRHVMSLREFFSHLFQLSQLFPGPYKIEHLENLLIMVKNVSTERFLSDSSDVFILAHYIREYVGVDHDIFLRLPDVVRQLITSEPTELLTIPFDLKNGEGEETSTEKEYLELCAISPCTAKIQDRVQLQLPSELTNPAYVKVFSWTFLPSREEPGIFYISNCQWNEFLVLEEHNNRPGMYRVTTTKDFNNKKCKFSLVLSESRIQIVSQLTLSPIVISERTQGPYVTDKGQMETGTFFSVKLKAEASSSS